MHDKRKQWFALFGSRDRYFQSEPIFALRQSFFVRQNLKCFSLHDWKPRGVWSFDQICFIYLVFCFFAPPAHVHPAVTCTLWPNSAVRAGRAPSTRETAAGRGCLSWLWPRVCECVCMCVRKRVVRSTNRSHHPENESASWNIHRFKLTAVYGAYTAISAGWPSHDSSQVLLSCEWNQSHWPSAVVHMPL